MASVAEGMWKIKRKGRRELIFQYRRYCISTVTFYKVFSCVIVYSKMTYKEQHTEKYKIEKNYMVGDV